MQIVHFVNGGHVSQKESALNAVTQWANSCERKVLIGLSCGTVLPRDRHRAWAIGRISTAKYLMRRDRRRPTEWSDGLVLLGGEPVKAIDRALFVKLGGLP